jgi:hypothetical protein
MIKAARPPLAWGRRRASSPGRKMGEMVGRTPAPASGVPGIALRASPECPTPFPSPLAARGEREQSKPLRGQTLGFRINSESPAVGQSAPRAVARRAERSGYGPGGGRPLKSERSGAADAVPPPASGHLGPGRPVQKRNRDFAAAFSASIRGESDISAVTRKKLANCSFANCGSGHDSRPSSARPLRSTASHD